MKERKFYQDPTANHAFGRNMSRIRGRESTYFVTNHSIDDLLAYANKYEQRKQRSERKKNPQVWKRRV